MLKLDASHPICSHLSITWRPYWLPSCFSVFGSIRHFQNCIPWPREPYSRNKNHVSIYHTSRAINFWMLKCLILMIFGKKIDLIMNCLYNCTCGALHCHKPNKMSYYMLKSDASRPICSHLSIAWRPYWPPSCFSVFGSIRHFHHCIPWPRKPYSRNKNHVSIYHTSRAITVWSFIIAGIGILTIFAEKSNLLLFANF